MVADDEELGAMRTLVLKAAVGVVTAVLGSTAVLVGLLSQRGASRVTHLWGKVCLKVAGAPLTVEGLEHIETGARYVIMSNHESSLDIVTLLTALPASLEPRFLAKKSLFSIPFLGWAMKSAGFVPVDREDRSTAAAMLARTLGEIEKGGSPLVFPEETWSTDGALLPFARGGFLIAIKTGLPILPVGLEGPRLVLPPNEGIVRPGPVIVRIGESIPTEGLGVSHRKELMVRTRREIDRLRGSAGHKADSH
ncbi:MAG: lysophospholipid acyltransferase family protein [Thermoanaerobaculales bacterium]|jgi:1-acyl-sn-glycerol-3-phosphate acyltransferase|nr:lysophospholipid acyltransferase family protein [Thermoanaerobaculales bacterium]